MLAKVGIRAVQATLYSKSDLASIGLILRYRESISLKRGFLCESKHAPDYYC
jgi:hypothetical protein